MDPDGAWTNGVRGGVWIGGEEVVVIPKTAADRANILGGQPVSQVIVHEVGHATLGKPPQYFFRGQFGPGDHSNDPGLMDRTGSGGSFTVVERDILRGYKNETP